MALQVLKGFVSFTVDIKMVLQVKCLYKANELMNMNFL